MSHKMLSIVVVNENELCFSVFLPDVNECETENGRCEASCQNTIGTYRCECPPGLRLQDNGRTCTGKLLMISY